MDPMYDHTRTGEKKALNEPAWTIVNLKEIDSRIASSPVISVKIK